LSCGGAADLSCAVAATPVTRQARRLPIAMMPRDVHLMGRTLLSAGMCDVDSRPRSLTLLSLLDHVGFHVSHSLRQRICPKSVSVKWLLGSRRTSRGSPRPRWDRAGRRGG